MRFMFLATATVTLLFASGCKPSEAKFCGHMRELYGKDMDDCEKDAWPEIQKQCKDPDAVVSCIMDAKDKKDANKCHEEKCGKK